MQIYTVDCWTLMQFNKDLAKQAIFHIREVWSAFDRIYHLTTYINYGLISSHGSMHILLPSINENLTSDRFQVYNLSLHVYTFYTQFWNEKYCRPLLNKLFHCVIATWRKVLPIMLKQLIIPNCCIIPFFCKFKHNFLENALGNFVNNFCCCRYYFW